MPTQPTTVPENGTLTQPVTTTAQPTRPHVRTAKELLEMEFPPGDSMLGNGLIDKGGAVLISGPQKIGKSLFGTQLALCLASQRDFLGFPVGNQAYKTLILQAEVSEKWMKDRFSKQTHGFPPDALERVLSASVFASVKLDSNDGKRMLIDYVQETQPDLVIIDPLANFHLGDENTVKCSASAGNGESVLPLR